MACVAGTAPQATTPGPPPTRRESSRRGVRREGSPAPVYPRAAPWRPAPGAVKDAAWGPSRSFDAPNRRTRLDRAAALLVSSRRGRASSLLGPRRSSSDGRPCDQRRIHSFGPAIRGVDGPTGPAVRPRLPGEQAVGSRCGWDGRAHGPGGRHDGVPRPGDESQRALRLLPETMATLLERQIHRVRDARPERDPVRRAHRVARLRPSRHRHPLEPDGECARRRAHNRSDGPPLDQPKHPALRRRADDPHLLVDERVGLLAHVRSVAVARR